MGSQSPQHHLHFLLVPLMSQSHLIPFADMARQLSDRGPLVTILLTPLNAVRFNSVLSDGLRIQPLVLPLPHEAAGLPEGVENMDCLPSSDLVMNFFEASNMLRGPLEEWLERAEPRPNCIVSDICFPWTADVSRRFGVPRVVFHGISCFTMFCSSNIKKYKLLESLTSDSERFVVPNMPDEVEFTRAQLPETRLMEKKTDMGETEDLLDSFKAAELSADGVMVNSFEELESNYVKGYRTVVKNLWCVGPVSLSKSAKSNRGNKSSIDESQCLKWLNSRNPRSVLYVCFGSLCHLHGPQLIELALGLESSKCAFVWVIRKGDYSEELDKWFLEEKYEHRVKDRGLIVRGWAPQVLILSHPSIMGFMTHCGWNSTLEGVAAGLPLITWPMFAEQFYNEKLIVHVIKTGVRVGAEKCVKWGDPDEEDDEKYEVLVKREDVKRAIERLMDEGEDGRERRLRANELGNMAKVAVEEGGSSYSNMSLMIQHVMDILKEKNMVSVCS